MGRPVTPLGRLGRRVADTQDRALHRPSMSATKQRLLAGPHRSRWPAGSQIRGAALAFALAAATAAAVLVLATRRPDDLTFAVTDTRGRVGEWVAPTAAELPVRFSDGSVLLIGPGSRARVAALYADGAVVVLERGVVDAAIVHRSASRWQIEVGPYSVKVTGTRFVVAWEPDTETLRLELKEGSTQVIGPKLGGGRAVVAGETLSVSTREDPPAIEPPPAPAIEVAPAISAPAPPRPQSAPSSLVLPSPPPALIAPSAAGPSPSWRALAAGGKYKEALERADGEGFDALLESEGSPDLLTLADAARLAGSLGQASRAYLAVRRRFPGSRDAAIAAWNLGRLAFDQRGAFTSAARWFRTYLAEQPSGAFARDASGRLVEALDRAGDAPGAREAARIYLESWPRGPHAEKAQSLLEKR